MTEKNIFTTSDLSLAAFLVIKGLVLTRAQKTNVGKFEFILQDPEHISQALSLEYINSDFCKFDNQIRSIKKLLYTK